MEVIPEGDNILETCKNTYWRASSGKTGKEAEIIVDLKCPIQLETFSIMNGFGGFGIKTFSLFGSRELTGLWAELYRGELPPGLEMKDEVIF